MNAHEITDKDYYKDHQQETFRNITSNPEESKDINND